MIAIQSKLFFEESIIANLVTLIKEKDINTNYFTQASSQYSIENCIIDLFNTFLGQNEHSEELYEMILPSFLEKTFKMESNEKS